MTYGVITICLNSAATIRRTITSVLDQTRRPQQYVFVDGGSTDGALDILTDTVDSGPARWPGVEFRLVHQGEARGIPNAWNMGLRELRTDLVFILNSDDWYDAGAAETVLGLFEQHPGTDILTGPVRYCSDEPDAAPRILRPKSFALFPFLMPVMHPGCFVKRSVYERVGGFNERYVISADYDFAYRCRAAGMVFRRYPKPFVNMQAQGLAARSRDVARRETAEIGRTHCRIPLAPLAARAVRALLGR